MKFSDKEFDKDLEKFKEEDDGMVAVAFMTMFAIGMIILLVYTKVVGVW